MNKLLSYYHKYREIVLYIFFGVITTIVSLATFWIFFELLSINELISNAMSWVLAVLCAFITNRTWVFPNQSDHSGLLRQAAKFYGGRVFTLVVEELILVVFITILGYPGMIVKFACQFIIMVLNYIISKFFVFK